MAYSAGQVLPMSSHDPLPMFHARTRGRDQGLGLPRTFTTAQFRVITLSSRRIKPIHRLWGTLAMLRSPRKILPALLALILLSVSTAAHADMANGSYLFDFSNILPLWDISGLYSGDIGPFSLNFLIMQDSSGRLTGTGTFYIDGLGGDITSITGSMTDSSTDPHVAMRLLMSGTGVLEGFDAKVTFSAHMHYRLNGTDKGL